MLSSLKATRIAPIPLWPSVKKMGRLRQAIIKLHADKIYPSGGRVSIAMGRKTKKLNGPENNYRRKVMRELGITLWKVGWAEENQYEDQTAW